MNIEDREKALIGREKDLRKREIDQLIKELDRKQLLFLWKKIAETGAFSQTAPITNIYSFLMSLTFSQFDFFKEFIFNVLNILKPEERHPEESRTNTGDDEEYSNEEIKIEQMVQSALSQNPDLTYEEALSHVLQGDACQS